MTIELAGRLIQEQYGPQATVIDSDLEDGAVNVLVQINAGEWLTLRVADSGIYQVRNFGTLAKGQSDHSARNP